MQSLTTFTVVNNTRIENKNVQIGSASLYSGLNFIINEAITTPID